MLTSQPTSQFMDSCDFLAFYYRDELIGLSGKVKITNPDILQNNNAPLALSITRTPSDDNVPLSSLPSSNASTKRYFYYFCNNLFREYKYSRKYSDFRASTLGSNSHPGTASRSLPEIPVDATKTNSLKTNVNPNSFMVYGTQDTNSDLYATLEEHKICNGLNI